MRARVHAQTPSEPDWRDGAAYAPLLGADRSLFAWEWLRRDRSYRAAAGTARPSAGARISDPAAARFGLVAFEAPHLSVPHARPLWHKAAWPRVIAVSRSGADRAGDQFDMRCMADMATLVAAKSREHLLLSDGLHAIRLDGPAGLFSSGPACFRYRVEGLASAEPTLLSLRQLVALWRTARFLRALHPREVRARRWILALRAWDGLAAGADQRQIAAVLLSRSAGQPRWRSRESHVRSQAQRLVHAARAHAGGGYRSLLR